MIVAIVGPTGIGKTSLSIALAKHLNAEIINADSVQIYKEPNVASAKPTIEERENIPHHLLGTKSLKDPSTIYTFQKEGRNIINKLLKENKNIIIVGGSGLYLKALLYNYELNEEKKTNNTYEELTNEELKEKVDAIYKENNIHKNNRKRLIRFLNHHNSTGKIIGQNEKKNEKLYDFKLIGLTIEREILYNILNKRVEEMLKKGLLEEATTLYNKSLPKLDSIIGYKELIPYFKGETTLENAIEEIKKDTRNYAKRQYTWYKNQMPDIKWFTVDLKNFNKTIKEVINYLS